MKSLLPSTLRCPHRLTVIAELFMEARERLRVISPKLLLRTLMLVLSTGLLLGCPARWRVVFINGTERVLKIQVSGSLNGKMSTLLLRPGRVCSQPLADVHSVRVLTADNHLLFEREQISFDLQSMPVESKYPDLYLLVTKTNILPVPHAYRRAWRSYIREK